MQGRKKSVVGADGVRRCGEPLREVPEPPAFLRPRAAEKFQSTCEYLIALGSITVGDLGLVARYAATFDRWLSAEEELAKGKIHWERLVTRTGDDGSAVPLPAMLQASKMSEALLKLEAALGLNPVERARLPVNQPVMTLEEELADEIAAMRAAR
jgi:P27 family predicted phage terminase small subunit